MRSKCLCVKDYNTELFPEFLKGNHYEYTDQHFVTREYPEGYNVQFLQGNYIYFRKYQDPLTKKGYGLFSTYFKTLKNIRKEKLSQINDTI